MTFKEFDLHESLQLGLNDIGFSEPTPIQEKSIPPALEGKDILGSAQTGTGKTGAFVIPLIETILRKPSDGTKALILTPTRELAQQIDEQIFALGYHTGLTSALVIGGEDFGEQANAIRAGVDIIIATPGRLIDQIKVLNIDFGTIRFLVLDEADRMLDMGFLPDVSSIIDRLPKKRQTMLFSATMPKELQKLMSSIMVNPFKIQIEASTASNRVDQRAYYAPPRKKLPLVQHLLNTLEWNSCIVFAATKKGTNQLEKLLNDNGIKAGSIHGDRSQEERSEALRQFKNGTMPVIVATDVLSRGIDIDNVSLIINYDVPKAVEDYIHRIGRTGRYDKEGIAVTFVSKADEKFFEPIRKKIGKDLQILDTEKAVEDVPKKSKSKQKTKPSKSKETEREKEVDKITDDIKMTTKKDGTVVVKLKSKEKETVQKKEQPKTEDKSKKSAKPAQQSRSKPKNVQSIREEKKTPQKTRPTNEHLIIPGRVEKATERLRYTYKPTKGVWGIIKTFIPKF